jgi:hypothetical protein
LLQRTNEVLAMSDPVYPLIIGTNVFQDQHANSIQNTDLDEFDGCTKPVVKMVIYDDLNQTGPIAGLDKRNTTVKVEKSTDESAENDAENNVDQQMDHTRLSDK